MMGARLVSLAFTRWSHLPDRPFRLLTHMALIVKDQTPNPTYWGGRDAMCQALGIPAQDSSSHTAVKRAIRKLIDAGAIRRTYAGHVYKRSEYLLTLDERGSSESPQRGSSESPHKGVTGDPKGGHLSAPLGEDIGANEDHREEAISPSKVTSPRPRPLSRRTTESRLEKLRAQVDAERERAS